MTDFDAPSSWSGRRRTPSPVDPAGTVPLVDLTFLISNKVGDLAADRMGDEKSTKEKRGILLYHADRHGASQRTIH